MTSDPCFFQIGGTLAEDSPSYIERPADRELLDALDRGDLCLVLSPRQTGKSSLMVHAMARLKPLGIVAVIVDFQQLGSQYDQNTWFGDVAHQIQRSLKLKTDAGSWWEEHGRLGATQRFMTFMEDVVLHEITGRVAIFFDEIDSILSLPFSDDFFTMIRALFNARASNPVLKRLNFVILGVATPSAFIKKRSRTPFNIGRMIELRDFEPSSLAPFKAVLGHDSEHLADRIFYWTSGQPLMVQRLTEAVYSRPPAERSTQYVDEVVQKTYLDKKIENDTHLKFIRDYLVEDNKKLRKTLITYREVLAGRDVVFNAQSPIHLRLKLAGVVRLDDQKFVPRNQIYERVFNPAWVKDNTPRDRMKMASYGASSALVLVLLWFFLLQPLLFLKFSRFQSFLWLNEDIYYTEQTTYRFDSQLPRSGIVKITLDNKKISREGTDNKQQAANIEIKLKNLPIGASEHRLRFYGGLWKENFETRLIVVSYPVTHWKPLKGLRMVRVLGRDYEMGCGEWDGECLVNEKLHSVRVDTFEIGKYEVTQDEWERIMGYNPSYFKKGGRYPVENVSWHHVQEFIRRLNVLAGKRGKKFRLPTEAEWEFAARSGGKPQKYAGGSNLDELAWYYKNSGSGTHPVGQKKKNDLEIFDMSGNVWEWCQDWYDSEYYKTGPRDNPKGPESGATRVIRGGSWYINAQYCRSAFRYNIEPGDRYFNVGCRLARSVNP